jgi:hypothetical protein
VQEAKCEMWLLNGLSHFNISAAAGIVGLPFVSYEEGLPLLPHDSQYEVKFCNVTGVKPNILT